MKDQNKEAHEIFRSFLKNGKNRVTPERFMVLDAALEMENHFGADDLYIEMKMKKVDVSRATVYNTLELLSQCELLVKRHFGDNITKYEKNIGKKNHDHLVCTNCGNIVEFSNPDIDKMVHKICDELDFDFEGYSFNIFGKCKHEGNCPHEKK